MPETEKVASGASATTLGQDDVLRNDIGNVATVGMLQQKAGEVRANKVNWQSYKQGQMITLEEFGVIMHIDFQSSDKESRAAYLRANADLSVKTLYRLISNISMEPTLQYIVTMIDDLIMEDRTRLEFFQQYTKITQESPWQPFFNLLNRKDQFIVHQTSGIIAKMACWNNELMKGKDLQHYIVFLKEQLRQPVNDYTQSVCRCLQMMLRIDEYRHAFVEAEGIAVVTDILRGKVVFQIQYQLIFCLWCLSYNAEIASSLNRYDTIGILANILSESVKEKVIRVIVATFRNLIDKPEEKEDQAEHARCMLLCKVPKQLSLLESRKFEDEDIVEDIKYVQEKLELNVQDLSSFDEYVTELKSGRLSWSPVHKELRFWRDNAARLNEKNYELIKILIHLLNNSRDPLILCVAAHDIGEYVRHYPRGKTVLEQLGGKEAVMRHLSHEDSNVKYEALLAVQKLMVHNWEYLGKTLGPDQPPGGAAGVAIAAGGGKVKE